MPFFVFLMMFFADASLVYFTHSDMYNAARDTARRMATGQLSTQEEVFDYLGSQLHLATDDVYVDPQFGTEMTVTIAVGFDKAMIFGTFFQAILGETLAATSTVQREPTIVR